MKSQKNFAHFFIITVLIVFMLFIGCSVCQTASVSLPPSSHESCRAVNEAEIAELFNRWNHALQTGDSRKVVALYANKSILLPTVSNKPRVTQAEKEDYFSYFLEKHPSGKIDLRQIVIGCNMAVDSGLYTFAFAKTGEVVKARYSFTYIWDGSQWQIVSHHSSVLPEAQ